jgi:UDP-N-acetylglucosamine acyltransferase
MPTIAPQSCVDPNACIADDVFIGPFCQIGPNVVIGAGCKLLGHVVVVGHTKIGSGNVIHHHVALGGPPQDKKYAGEPTGLEIGNNNVLREGFTANIGTVKGGGCTRIGNNNLLMTNSHIGHDAQIGDDCVMANNVMIAGHVVCGHRVNLMGGAGVHHFVTIGDYAYIGGAARIHHDVPPFMIVDGADEVRGLNAIGLERAGFTPEEIAELDEACRRLFYRRKPLAKAMEEYEALNGTGRHVKTLVEFLRRRNQGKKGRYLESLRH